MEGMPGAIGCGCCAGAHAAGSRFQGLRLGGAGGAGLGAKCLEFGV